MKFSLFLHMERYDSNKPHKALFDEMTELVNLAESGGFETAWIGEHHGMEFTIAPNPFINLAYLAGKTSTIRLGTGTVVAPFWHPIRLAGEIGMTDLACDGRLDVGIARGAYAFEYERMFPGLDAWGAGGRLREMIPCLQKLFFGDYTHQGEYWNFPKTTPVPRPLQQPHPPLWVAARDPNSHDFAVSAHCNVQVTSLAAGDDEVASLIARFNAACANHPAIARPKIMMLMHTFVGKNELELIAAATDLRRFYSYFGKWFKNEKPIKQGFIEELNENDLSMFSNYDEALLRQNLVIGTPDAVIARLKGYEKLGYDQYSFWIDSHMKFERKKKSLELFINEVMPAFA